jgi:hypothetical protein
MPDPFYVKARTENLQRDSPWANQYPVKRRRPYHVVKAVKPPRKAGGNGKASTDDGVAHEDLVHCPSLYAAKPLEQKKYARKERKRLNKLRYHRYSERGFVLELRF